MTNDTLRIIGELMEFEKALGWFNTGYGSISKGQRTINRVISHFGQLEQRISDLEKHVPAGSTARGVLTAEEIRLIEHGNRIDAIKSVRSRLGLSLRDARDIVLGYRG